MYAGAPAPDRAAAAGARAGACDGRGRSFVWCAEADGSQPGGDLWELITVSGTWLRETLQGQAARATSGEE